MNKDLRMTESETVNHVAQQDVIMQDIQSMIGNLFKETVENMQRKEMDKQIVGAAGSEQNHGKATELEPAMDMKDVKKFLKVMQQFIDSANSMIMQFESGNAQAGSADNIFIDGYIATADNILEIAAFSMKDDLTGLSNRYGFDNRIILEWNRAAREKSALSLLIFGVDRFDQQLKDDVFKAIAQVLEGSIKRSTDFVARWSDDEFVALLPITESSGAMIVAERIREEIEKLDIKPSVFIGLNVQTPESNGSLAGFIDGAHNAYKKAKNSGQSAIVFES